MGANLDWHESADDLERDAQNEPNAQRRRRLLALSLVQRGHPIESVAGSVGVSPRTIQRWLALYRRGRLAEVVRRVPGHQARGRRPRLSREQIAELVARHNAGQFPTIGEALAWVKATWGVDYTYKGLHTLLRRASARSGFKPSNPTGKSDTRKDDIN